MIRTESAALKACSVDPPTSSQATRVTSAMTSTAGTKTAGDAIGQPLDRRLLVLGVLDKPDHVSQLGVLADLRGLDHQAAPDRHRATDDTVAGSHVDGK